MLMSGVSSIISNLLISITVFVCIGCKHSDKKSAVHFKTDPCLNIPKEIDTTIIFGSVDLNSHWKDFDSTVKFLESKGSLKQTIVKDRIKIDHWKDYYLRMPIDTCNKQFVTMNFILKNVTAPKCLFKSKIELKNNNGYFPGFVFSQLNFVDNADRDKALRIIQWVYLNGGTLYEYKYNQTIVKNKTIYFIEPNAKIFEDTAIIYAKYLRDYIDQKSY